MGGLKERLMSNVVNIPGWRTNRKIIVIESDDWGSTRVRSSAETNALINKGFSFEGKSFYQNDGLESNDDLVGLFEVLSRHKDKTGRQPVFTLVSNVANPDFEKIEQHDFKEYFWEPFTDTLKKYPVHDQVLALHKEGIANRLIYPTFHGREHLNVQRWMRYLQEGNKSVHTAFKHGVCSIMHGIDNEYLGELPAAFALEFASDLDYQKSVIVDGLAIFEDIWGFKARYFVPPNGPFNSELEKNLLEGGVEYILGEKNQNEPLGDGKFRKRFHYTGMKNNSGQVYLSRNAAFEPGISENDTYKNALQKGLKSIERAFRWHKPAIVSSHRINYVGFLNPDNRDNGLKMLDNFLTEVINRWPEVEFMTSVELGDLITQQKKHD
jgi:hypothetical protein